MDHVDEESLVIKTAQGLLVHVQRVYLMVLTAYTFEILFKNLLVHQAIQVIRKFDIILYDIFLHPLGHFRFSFPFHPDAVHFTAQPHKFCYDPCITLVFEHAGNPLVLVVMKGMSFGKVREIKPFRPSSFLQFSVRIQTLNLVKKRIGVGEHSRTLIAPAGLV